MEQIQDLVESVKDKFNGLFPVDDTKVDSVLGKAKQYGLRILRNITNRDTSNTDIVNALVERQLYGKSSEKADTLWAIAKKYYGSGSQYTKIYNANKDKIKNPNLIYPGQVIKIP